MTVVVSSHNLRDIERGCTRVVVMRDGQVVADDPLADFRARADVRQIRVRTQLSDDRLRALPGVVHVATSGETASGAASFDDARLIDSRDADATLHALLRLDASARDITVNAPRLEDVLREILRAGGAS